MSRRKDVNGPNSETIIIEALGLQNSLEFSLTNAIYDFGFFHIICVQNSGIKLYLLVYWEIGHDKSFNLNFSHTNETA